MDTNLLCPGYNRAVVYSAHPGEDEHHSIIRSAEGEMLHILPFDVNSPGSMQLWSTSSQYAFPKCMWYLKLDGSVSAGNQFTKMRTGVGM